MKKRPDRPPIHRHTPDPSGQRAQDEANVFLEAVALLGVGHAPKEAAKPAAAPSTAQRIAAARPVEKPVTRADADARLFEEAMRALDTTAPKRGTGASGSSPIQQRIHTPDAAAADEALRSAVPKIETDSDLFLASVRPVPAMKPHATQTIERTPDHKQIRVVAELDR